MSEISLRVGELTDRAEYGRGIVRVDTRTMSKLGVREGDVIELQGKRKTAAIAVRAYPADAGLDVIRMDGITRRNAGIGVGETIKIVKAEVKEAKRVVLAPTQKGIILQMDPELLRKNLFMRAVVKGDIITPFPVVKRRGSPFGDFFGLNIEDMFFTPIPGGETKLAVVSTSPEGVVKITDYTDLELKPEAVVIEEKVIPTITYEDIGGLHPAIEKVREMIELPLRHPELFGKLGIEPPKGVLLYGPPGTGKTLLAKAVANESGAYFTSISGPEVTSKWYGESEKRIRELFADAEKNAPAIIFIDEIDALAPKREEVTGEVERRMVSQLLSCMDGLKSRGKLIVIAATNRENALDPALRRPGRFDREIEIGVPDTKGRKEILQIHTRNMPLTEDVDLNWLANITYGFVGADLEALCKEAAMSALRRNLPGISWKKEELPPKALEKLRVTKKDFANALKLVEPSAMREVLIEIPNVKWKDIGGLEEVKESLKEVIQWPLKHPKSFKRIGIKPPAGVLLYGPPGCGKTLLAKAVANESGANFISIRGPECLTMWVGESERKIREIFRRARQVAPSIIFFDEIDALAPRRGLEVGTRVTENVVSMILTEMSGLEELHNVIVVAASITGDTPVLVKQNNTYNLLPISNVIDPYYREGEENVEKVISGLEVLGFERKSGKKGFGKNLYFGNSAFKKVRSVFRHKVNEIYEIEYNGGKIKTTGNHSLFVRTSKGIERKLVAEMKTGDILVDLPYKVNRTTKRKEIRYHEFNQEFNLELPVWQSLFEKFEPVNFAYQYALTHVNEISQTELGKIFGFSQRTIGKWQQGICGPRVLSRNYYQHRGVLPEKVEVTPDLMRLFGYYVAEGYARKEIDLCFNRSEKEKIEDIKNLMKKLFNLEPQRIRFITPGAINITYQCTPLANFFAYHCGKGAKNKHIPPFLFEAPFEYFKEFFKGYLGGDGYIYKNRKGKGEVTSVSKQLILELNWLFRMHGFKSYIHSFRTKKGRKILNGKPLPETIAWRLGFGKTQNPLNDEDTRIKGSVYRPVIKSVKKIPYNGYVYDFCGCENEAFFAGENPILAHNTNRPDILDPAILRPGRFDRQVLVPAPDEQTRLAILKIHTKEMPLAKDVNLKKLAKITENYSGADLEALCREAGLNALRESFETKIVSKKHFDQALKKVKPSIDSRVIDFYNKMIERFKTSSIKEEKREKEIGYVG